MPTGIYKHKPRSKETIMKLRESAIRRGFGLCNKGKHHSEKTRLKISIALTGKKMKPMSDKTRKQRRDYLLKNPVKYWLGKHMPEEMKRKIGDGNRGKHHSDETKGKISVALKGKYKGEKSSNWKGGITFKVYSIQFNRELRELIRQRDNFQCQLCGMPECENIHRLSIHHIDYDKQNSLPSNLISVCKRCNTKVNYNREYWKGYFENKFERK